VRTVSVRISSERRYDIVIGTELLSDLTSIIDLRPYTQILVLTDSHVAPLYLDRFLEDHRRFAITAHVVQAGEESKSLAVYEDLQRRLAALNFDRRSLVVNIGGGVVSDLGGFVASTYRRGVPFVNVATTVEGMVDASVGGKTGVNLGPYKNYVGTYAQPAAVVIDVATLRTLDDRNRVAGWAEVIKHGLIASRPYYDTVTSKHPLSFSDSELTDIVTFSCELKRGVVEEDESESGVRKILNFGHTVGHAVESLSYQHSPLLHGEAVAIGMVAEARLALGRGAITRDEYDDLKARLARCGLPTRIPFALPDLAALTALIGADKKNHGGRVRWSLLSSIGSCEYDVLVGDGPVADALRAVAGVPGR
jgi:3-dehydroquinate synthase